MTRRVWALLLCVYLLAWVPFTFASEFLVTVPSLEMRGMPAAVELLVHGLVAMLCATAGWMIWVRSPAAQSAATGAVLVSGLASLQSIFWTVLPRNLAPGDELPLSAAVGIHMLFWLVLIRRSGVFLGPVPPPRDPSS
jgi:hypothetical protein